jgi:hypothetical protein
MSMYICVLGLSILSVSTIFLITFWNCCDDVFFILFLNLIENCDYGKIICVSFLLSLYPFFPRKSKAKCSLRMSPVSLLLQ